MAKIPVNWNKFVEIYAKENNIPWKDALSKAGTEWKEITEGLHSKYTQGKPPKKTQKKKSKPKKGHKGAPSITREGRIDFRTHKGDKLYHRHGHRYTYNIEGVEGKPYSHRKSRKGHKGRKSHKIPKGHKKSKKSKRSKRSKSHRKTAKNMSTIRELQLELEACRKQLASAQEKLASRTSGAQALADAEVSAPML